MNIKFDPNNPIIKLCMIGMGLEENGNSDEALAKFQKAWQEARDDYERFITSYHLGRIQKSTIDKLKWMDTSLQCALKIKDENVKSAYPTLYLNLAKCYEELGDSENAKKNYDLSNSAKGAPTDVGGVVEIDNC
jgi:rifampin ADP-ribosylating transferase